MSVTSPTASKHVTSRDPGLAPLGAAGSLPAPGRGGRGAGQWAGLTPPALSDTKGLPSPAFVRVSPLLGQDGGP